MDIHIKRGASLNLHFAFQNDDGTPFAIASDAVLTSDVVDPSGLLVTTLPLTVDTSGPGLLYSQISDTSTWPLGQLRCDIAIQQEGLTVISDTFPIYVDPPVTVLA